MSQSPGHHGGSIISGEVISKQSKASSKILQLLRHTVSQFEEPGSSSDFQEGLSETKTLQGLSQGFFL